MVLKETNYCRAREGKGIAEERKHDQNSKGQKHEGKTKGY